MPGAPGVNFDPEFLRSGLGANKPVRNTPIANEYDALWRTVFALRASCSEAIAAQSPDCDLKTYHRLREDEVIFGEARTQVRLEDFLGGDVDLDEVARWARDGDSLEVILTRLRDVGCDVPGCIAVLDAAGVVPLSEAKAAVVFSETWKDQLPQNRAFQENLGEFVEEGETERGADAK